MRGAAAHSPSLPYCLPLFAPILPPSCPPSPGTLHRWGALPARCARGKPARRGRQLRIAHAPGLRSCRERPPRAGGGGRSVLSAHPRWLRVRPGGGMGGVAAALRIRVRGRRAQCRGEPAPRGRPEARRAAAAGSPSARPAPPALSAEPRGRPGLPGVAASPLRARGCPGEGAEATCCRCPEPAETRRPAVLARGPDFC